jgi:hypothetical protein
MILCSKLENVLCNIGTKSHVVTKFSVTKSRLHCTNLIFVFDLRSGCGCGHAINEQQLKWDVSYNGFHYPYTRRKNQVSYEGS